MKKMVCVAGSLVVSLFIYWSIVPGVAVAQEENPVKNILLDTFYGLAAGALVGLAISAPQDDPDWQQNIGSGAAIGAVAGLVFGVVYEGKPLIEESRAIMDVEDSRVTFQLPSINTRAMEDEDKQPQTSYHLDLICYRF